MESKNVKVIDEHGIDRNANIICSIDVDGSDYVVYWIERDNDNDNVFVSKMLKNIDGTSNMVNIEDTMEKGKISDIVKELIMYAINNEANKLSTSSVNLPSGKNVGVSSILINREQNINVQKTYITTVKKTVTKVSEDFYSVGGVTPVPEVAVSPSVAPIFEDIMANAPKVVSSVELSQEVSVVPETPVIPEVTPVISTPSVVIPEPEVVSEVKIPEPVIVLDEPEISTSPVIPVVPVNEQVVKSVESEVSKTAELESPVVIPTPVVTEPVVSPVIPEVKPSEPDVHTPVENKMVFDGTKETNLNVALGEVSVETPISIDNVEPIREFGVDEVKTTSEPAVTTAVEATPVVTDAKNGGFAHNKFFMVVAISFFVASCVFLGYEVFQYFQIK